LTKKNRIDHIDEQVENEAPIVFVCKHEHQQKQRHLTSIIYLLVRPGFVWILIGIDLSSQSLEQITHRFDIISLFRQKTK